MFVHLLYQSDVEIAFDAVSVVLERKRDRPQILFPRHRILRSFFMKKVYRIPSRLYYELYKRGGDKLVAMFSILKTSKQNDVKYQSFTASNGKKVSYHNLIRKKTGLTIHSIRKYTAILIEMELCYFESDGSFVVLGNNKLKKEYTRKLVPILIGKNLIDTSYNSFLVRLHSNELKQQKAIAKKTHQRVLKCKKEEELTYSDIKQLKSLKSKKESGFFTDKSVLSIKAFAAVKDGSKNNKSKGLYWKRKMIQKNLIETKRQFDVVAKMTKTEFDSMKFTFPNNVVFEKSGLIVEEKTSLFFIKNQS